MSESSAVAHLDDEATAVAHLHDTARIHTLVHHRAPVFDATSLRLEAMVARRSKPQKRHFSASGFTHSAHSGHLRSPLFCELEGPAATSTKPTRGLRSSARTKNAIWFRPFR